MWFRLAALWGCTVGEAQGRCDAREFAEWTAYYRLEPFGCEADDYRAALVCAVTANASRGKGGRSASPKDFMPRWGRPPEEQTPEQMLAVLRGLPGARVVGGSAEGEPPAGPRRRREG